MHSDIATVLLWLFVVNHGVAFGAGIYEHRIVVPQWIGRTAEQGIYLNTHAMRIADTGRRFWGLVTTGPLSLLTLANLVFAWQAEGPARVWWLAFAIVTFLERFGTFAYFIPTAIRLMNASEPLTEASKTSAMRWVSFNRVRLTLSLLGWLCALTALSLVK